MVIRLILLAFILVPAIEISGFITIGGWIGAWETLLLIFLTAIVGAILMKKEAQRVLGKARSQLSEGQLPGMAMIEGICIFIGGLLLMLPGFFTDAVGLLMVLPGTRHLFSKGIVKLLKKGIKNGNVRFIRWY